MPVHQGSCDLPFASPITPLACIRILVAAMATLRGLTPIPSVLDPREGEGIGNSFRVKKNLTGEVEVGIQW